MSKLPQITRTEYRALTYSTANRILTAVLPTDWQARREATIRNRFMEDPRTRDRLLARVAADQEPTHRDVLYNLGFLREDSPGYAEKDLPHHSLRRLFLINLVAPKTIDLQETPTRAAFKARYAELRKVGFEMQGPSDEYSALDDLASGRSISIDALAKVHFNAPLESIDLVYAPTEQGKAALTYFTVNPAHMRSRPMFPEYFHLYQHAVANLAADLKRLESLEKN